MVARAGGADPATCHVLPLRFGTSHHMLLSIGGDVPASPPLLADLGTPARLLCPWYSTHGGLMLYNHMPHESHPNANRPQRHPYGREATQFHKNTFSTFYPHFLKLFYRWFQVRSPLSSVAGMLQDQHPLSGSHRAGFSLQ